MRSIVLASACVLALAACSPQGPDGATAPPPADALPPAAPAIPAAFSGDLDARGTEPFWGLQIRGAQITLQRPDHPDLAAANPGPAMTDGKAVWTSTAGTETLIVTLSLEACSDGMSDLKYAYAAQVILGGETLKGCAGKAGAMPKEG